jgi:hypothetical protein
VPILLVGCKADLREDLEDQIDLGFILHDDFELVDENEVCSAYIAYNFFSLRCALKR